MKICPKCGGKRFIVPACVVEHWVVDENGEFIEVASYGDVVRSIDNDVWECEKCGYTSSGDGMEMKEYDVTISYTTSRIFTVKARNESDAVNKAVDKLDHDESPISYYVFDSKGKCVEDGMF